MRVVSLLPAATELLYTLGVEPVGVSHECDYPPPARELPAVTSTPVDPVGSTAEINEQVAEAVEDDGVFSVDEERLVDLEPDLIVSQGTCDVCAIDGTRIRSVIDGLDLDADVVTIDPHRLADVFDDLARFGELLGREEKARTVTEDLRGRIEAVRTATPETGPRVAVFDWLDPVMVAAHWVPELVELAGGEYGLAEAGEPARPRDWAEIREYDPEVLVAAPCGFELDQVRVNAGALSGRDGWSDLSAVESGRVFAMDGHNYVNRPGPRLVDTVEIFASLFHPDAVDFEPSEVVEWHRLEKSLSGEVAD